MLDAIRCLSSVDPPQGRCQLGPPKRVCSAHLLGAKFKPSRAYSSTHLSTKKPLDAKKKGPSDFYRMCLTYGKKKTYNSGYSLVVTHLTTNPPVRCLNRAERTGSLVFNVLWSYVISLANNIL